MFGECFSPHGCHGNSSPTLAVQQAVIGDGNQVVAGGVSCQTMKAGDAFTGSFSMGGTDF